VVTNSTSLYSATGIITTYTNTTSGNTASYYLQDGTGGINIFATFGSTWRPSIGDEYTFVGFLSSFQGVMELSADLQNNLATGPTFLSNNIAGMPTPKLISWDSLATNDNANIEYNIEGSLVMLTNVYFVTNAGTVMTAANLNCQVTNASGQVGYVYFYAQQVNDFTNQTLPAFAYAVVGPLTQNTNSHAGYQVIPTRWADVVTTIPSVTLDAPANGATGTAPTNITLSATVTSNSYPIAYVGFYNGATLIANVTNSPYTYVWNAVGAGTYPLSAKVAYAISGVGFTAASGVNTLTVNNATPPTVSGITVSAGTATISGTTTPSRQLVTEKTLSLAAPISWSPVATNNAALDGSFSIPIPVGTDADAFFRVKGL
jgi:hypothetical protein